jgi:biopolymer transport protein ExbB
MTTLFDLLSRGGPVIIPVLALSAITVTCGLERCWFWWQTLRGEDRLVQQILDAAEQDLDKARHIAQASAHRPIARFLLAALALRQPNPETFRLALEAAGDREFVQMRRYDKLLETIVGIAPLLGLLGTVTGLIVTFFNLKIGGSGSSIDTSNAAVGIAEALITTAGGMIVAIMALVVFRSCVALQAMQIDYFADVGNRLELIYRQRWHEPMQQTQQQAILKQLAALLSQGQLPEASP